MAEYQLQLKTNADASALDELITKLQQMTELEEETGNRVIRPDADPSELDEITQKLFDIQETEEETSSTPIMDIASLTVIADKISNIGSKLEGLSESLAGTTSTIDKLSIQSGVSADELTRMTTSLSSANFSEDSALQYIKALDQIGVSSENLETSAKGLKSIGSALQLDPSTVTGMANELSVLGVDMNNVSSAFGALGYASANTVGGMQNYYTFLKRFDSQFAELGMNVDQSSVAIVAATKKYGGGRAALSGLSEALKNSNGDLSKMEQELGLQAGALTNASQTTSQYANNINEMAAAGAKHLTITQRINDAFRDMAVSLAPVIEPLGSIVGAFGQLGGLALNFNALTQFYNTLKESEKIAGMVETLRAAISASTAAEGIGASVKAFFTTALGAETAAKIASIGPTVTLAGAEMSLLWPVLAVAAAILVLVGILYYLYNNNEQVRQAVDNLIASVKGLIGAFMEAIQPIISFVQQGIAYLMTFVPAVQQIFGAVFNFIISILAALFTQGINNVTMIVNGIRQVFSMLSPSISAIFGAVQRIILAAITRWNMATTRARQIVSAITSAFSKVRSTISSAMSGVTNAITAPFSRAYNTIKPIIDNIKKAWDMLNSVAGSSGIIPGSAGVVLGSAGIVSGGSSGFANSNLMTNISNTTGGTTNIQLSGIIEESAGDFIVRKLNDELYKQRIVRGI